MDTFGNVDIYIKCMRVVSVSTKKGKINYVEKKKKREYQTPPPHSRAHWKKQKKTDKHNVALGGFFSFSYYMSF